MCKDGLVSTLLLLQRSLFFRIDGHAHPEQQHSRNVRYGGVTNCDRLRHTSNSPQHSEDTPTAHKWYHLPLLLRSRVVPLCSRVVALCSPHTCCSLSVICDLTQIVLPTAAAVG